MVDKIRHTGKDDQQRDMYVFYCPGCRVRHSFRVPPWGFNGSIETPTVEGSVLVDAQNPEQRCHSFIADGRIQFLDDSFHSLAGKTVELPAWNN